jgi:hypothetical protein
VHANTVRFVLDGRIVEARGVRRTMTVLDYLREHLHRTGTKELSLKYSSEHRLRVQQAWSERLSALVIPKYRKILFKLDRHYLVKLFYVRYQVITSRLLNHQSQQKNAFGFGDCVIIVS